MRTGTKGSSVVDISHGLINKYNNLAVLSSKSVDSLMQEKGIGRDKAATLAACFEIARRVSSQQKTLWNKKITSPSDVANYFIPMMKDEIKEKFIVICLNSANKINKYEVISVGNLNSSIVHPREVFKVAIDNDSANIIILHNHPSGNEEPSNEDISITKKIVEAGKILDIQVFDHIIIAGNSFTSFVERHLI